MLSAGGAVKGSAGYVAIERVTGTLHGRRGSFTLQHFATMTRGEPHLNIVVVPDSGSGELTGLRGAMKIVIADVRAEVPGAERDHAVRESGRALGDRDAEGASLRALVGDPLPQRAADAMRLPRRTEERLVEVAVAVDQRGEQQRAAELDRRRPGADARAMIVDRRDAPIAQLDVGAPAVGEGHVHQLDVGGRAHRARV
jgi:hypothetical protein